ncbi:siderophore esterase IroE [Truncatella angustata]|uniref:Siderophore esterase IroE n=1 Tax=Truncatella angustata TaxID=152316 RepID=A0A9P8USJ7_9PEZI|nr:siderophore esterase IroE [Truncatella angustata]KAH6658285.1 siderophore esterase IroE [Truncatella angustata]
MALNLERAHPPNTCQYTAHSSRGDYLVQIAWPLRWGEDRNPPESDSADISTIYLVDGNAYFFTAVDIVRRLEFTHNTRAVVVGVGYPPSKIVYDRRRGPDLTPSTADGKFEMPLDRHGNPRTDLSFGEADIFLDFIQNDVMKYVHETLFPQVSLNTHRKALFGHSYGGIFALNALYTKPALFDTFIAASPNICWNNSSLVKEQEAAFLAREHPVNLAPALLITWGSGPQDLVRGEEESEVDFEKRISHAELRTTRDSATALVARMNSCAHIRSVLARDFPGEDHGSAAVTGLQFGIQKFLADKF